MHMDGISNKIYLAMNEPTEDDNRSEKRRILDSLAEQGICARMPIKVMRMIYPLCEEAKWKMTVSLAWDGDNWVITNLESGDTTNRHYGVAVDLGSTTIVSRMIDCNTGECIGEVSCYNKQIAFGTDILTRIFYCKDDKEKLNEMRMAAVDSINENLLELQKMTGVSPDDCIQMVVAGNTTMTHFLIGMDAFCVFHTPYAVHVDAPEFMNASDMGIHVNGYVFCYPGKSNYLGGDIISGMISTEMYKKDEISVFFDIGTNGELVVGNNQFLLCGAGAAGPALEGGVVKTGMRAAKGAVETVRLVDGVFEISVIGGGEPQGICGSGIIDLLAELFLNGWIDIRGKFVPEKSPLIQEYEEGFAVEYAKGLLFWQDDIEEFIRTKAAAHTMVEYMMRESGISLEEIGNFYVAGAFGKHVSKESAIAIGMYPDMDRERIINAGNTSLLGAQKLLLEKSVLEDLEEILEKMIYIQFGAVDDFLIMMVAARALPHTNMENYPSVMKKLGMKILQKN